LIAAGSIEFAHARIWARHGQRPDEALWRRIETTREFAAVLELARGSALAGWLEGIAPGADVHAVEAALRRHWRERVAELASWMPPAWQAAIEWCGVLVDLPAVQHLARGAAPADWMAGDERLRALLEGAAPGGDGLRALLAAARAEPARLLPLWQAEWQRRLPPAASRAGGIAALASLLAAHAAAFAAPQAIDGWALRRTLQGRLVLLLRRALIEPVAAFVYLALSALEFERLRGELLRRAAFPGRWATP
jgi:hypothetical protein